MNQCLKHFSKMKYRDSKEKSYISTKLSKEFQSLIGISSFCGSDELFELKKHGWLFTFGLASHIDFCEFARIGTLLYGISVVPLLYVKIHCSVAFVLISANVV